MAPVEMDMRVEGWKRLVKTTFSPTVVGLVDKHVTKALWAGAYLMFMDAIADHPGVPFYTAAAATHPHPRYYARTHQLLQSTDFDYVGVIAGWMTAEVWATAAYAPFVEYGTVKHPAYPFLRPAFEKHRKAAEALVRKALKQAMVLIEKLK